MSWTREQRNVTIAAYLGWTLDAFDFFLMVFILKDIAAEFNTKIPEVALGITLTLAMRPIGALIFGRLADKYGRRPTLMVISPSIRCWNCCRVSHRISLRCSCCARCSVLQWAANGASARPSPWKLCRPKRAALSRVFCKRVIRAAICWLPLCSALRINTLAGAVCSSLAWLPHCWFYMCAHTCPN